MVLPSLPLPDGAGATEGYLHCPPLSLFSLMKGMRSMKGGMGVITAGLYEKVKDSVRLNTPVKKVVIKDNKVVGVETKDGFVEADQVICGLDAVLARQSSPTCRRRCASRSRPANTAPPIITSSGWKNRIVDRKDTPLFVVMIPPDEAPFCFMLARQALEGKTGGDHPDPRLGG